MRQFTRLRLKIEPITHYATISNYAITPKKWPITPLRLKNWPITHLRNHIIPPVEISPFFELAAIHQYRGNVCKNNSLCGLHNLFIILSCTRCKFLNQFSWASLENSVAYKQLCLKPHANLVTS